MMFYPYSSLYSTTYIFYTCIIRSEIQLYTFI